MNKLPVSIERMNEDLDTLKISKESTQMVVEGNRKIKNLEVLVKEFHIKLVIMEHSSLTLGCITEIENINGTIEIENLENSTLTLHLGIRAKKNNFLSIQNKLSNNNSASEIKVRIIGENNSHTKVVTRGILESNTKDNIFLEDVKYLIEETSCIECVPELFVSTNECTANHNVTIGSIEEEELFYLESKGIEKEVSKSFLRDCFLKSMLIREEE